MALSGLNCPKCSSGLRDEATECHSCKASIGKKEWKQALDNEYLKFHEKDGLLTFIRWRITFVFRLKMYSLRRALKKFFQTFDTSFRRLFVRFI